LFERAVERKSKFISLDIKRHTSTLLAVRDKDLLDLDGLRRPHQIQRKSGTASDSEVPLKSNIATLFPKDAALGHLQRRTEHKLLRYFDLPAEPSCHLTADDPCCGRVQTQRRFAEAL
jgi:hypothetical protein